jgi:hypothetical protein
LENKTQTESGGRKRPWERPERESEEEKLIFLVLYLDAASLPEVQYYLQQFQPPLFPSSPGKI